MKSLIDILKERAVFEYCRDGVLYYETESGFRFGVPVNEMGTATYNHDEKAIALMKWLKPQYEAVTETS